MELENRIKKIVAEHLGLENEIKLTDDFIIDLGADSLDAVELTMTLEDEYEIDITDQELEKIHIVSDLVNTVQRLVSEKESKHGGNKPLNKRINDLESA